MLANWGGVWKIHPSFTFTEESGEKYFWYSIEIIHSHSDFRRMRFRNLSKNTQ